MKVYLAAQYKQKEEIKLRRDELQANSIVCTSRWLDEGESPKITLPEAQQQLGEERLVEIARTDIVDIMRADVTVLFTIDPTTPHVRGGRHFESGFAFGLQLLHEYGWVRGTVPRRQLVTVGPKENIFHHLPAIRNFATWEECLGWLIEEKRKREEAGSIEQAGLEFGEAATVERCS